MSSTDEVTISHLQRRKIEGRVLLPFIKTLTEKYGEEATLEILDATISRLAAEDGAAWAATWGTGTESLRQVAVKVWAGSGALDLQILEENRDRLDFNVTRCRYAEFYKELGLTDIGFHIHCKRDLAMVTGFDPDMTLDRTQTIMQGASCCDFRFRKNK